MRKIEYAVEQSRNPEAGIFIGCVFRPDIPDGPLLGYIDFTVPHDDGEYIVVTHAIGIPLQSLHKTQEMAEWVINQIKPTYPEWFLLTTDIR